MAAVTPLKLAIVESGRSQREVAAAVGISEFKLSRIVNRRARPGGDVRDALARALDRTPASLFDDDEPERKAAAA